MESTLSSRLRPNSQIPFILYKSQFQFQFRVFRPLSQILLRKKTLICASITNEDISVVEKREKERETEFLVREFGWGVKELYMVEEEIKLYMVDEEIKLAAFIQAEAFHKPVALFNDFFFEFSKFWMLLSLISAFRTLAPKRFACLVAESINESKDEDLKEIVGIVELTVQSDKSVLVHINSAEEFLYISGLAVLEKFRRKKVATVLLKACDVLAQKWRHKNLALHTYEDDFGARNLYSNAGFEVVLTDPIWMTWIGIRRRVLMIKKSDFNDDL